jgi:HK97 family phage major capsid protein
MNAKLKSLNESVGALKKEIRTHLDSADRQKMSAEQRAADTRLTDLENKFSAAALDFDAEFRQAARESSRPVELTKSEVRTVDSFDYKTLLTHLHRTAKGSPSQLSGAEAELVQEGEKEARDAGIQSGSVVLPRVLVRRGGYEKRDMTASGTTSVTGDQGGMTIATDKLGLLDDFFAASAMRASGATVLEGLMGNLDIPRIVSGTAGAKKAENAAADEISPTTLMLSLTPNRLPGYVDISERLLLQSSSAIAAVIRNNITGQMLATQEAAFFHGGGTNEAYGIAGTSGIGSVAGGTNGAAPTLDHVLSLEEAVDATNALLGNLHYATNGQIRKKLKGTPAVASTDSRMLLSDMKGAALNGYDPVFTNAISRTLTKGSASGTCSAIFFGNFSDYYMAYWSGLSLEMVRDKTNAISGLYTLVASSYYSGGVARPKSFAAMLDALGA